MGFVFYDTETTGLNSAFDQILQFAAIRTDPELNEIDRFETRSRLRPDVIPHPAALHVTGTTVGQLTDKNLPSHYEMVCEIRAKMLDWSPTIFIGHNSMAFDENFLRQSLYQTLHPPYLTNTSGNCRSDSLRIVQAASVFAPGCLSIPMAGNKPIYKLDQLAPANGFDHSNAHDALEDVKATIFICKLIVERAPDFWSNIVRVSQKQAALDFVLSEELFCLFDTYYGKPYAWIVTPLGRNPENSSEFLVFDLFVDPKSLKTMTNEELLDRLAKSPKPVRSIRLNACPLIFPVEDSPDIAKATNLDPDDLTARTESLASEAEFRTTLVDAFLSLREPWESSVHVEEQIYEGFLTAQDEQSTSIFHETDWSDRYSQLDKISDLRMKSLGQRLIHDERPDVLPANVRKALDQEFAQRMLASDDNSPPWLTIPKAIQATDDLLSKSEQEEPLLSEYRSYLEERLKAAKALL